MKKISVVMPVYNVEKYIRTAIVSVLNQSYKNFELIIVDDGSTDSSKSIYSQFADPKIKIIKQVNRGLAGARNTGIRAATGEYVAFLDSDDVWSKFKLESHVLHLNCNSHIGVSYSHSTLIDEAGNSLGINQAAKTRDINFRDIICRNPIGNGSSPVIRKSVLEEVSFQRIHKGKLERCYFDETFTQSEDVEYWMRIFVRSDLEFEGINKCLTQYRVNASGLSANLDKQLDSWTKVVDKIAVIAPKRISKWRSLARAYQLRYLARRAIKNGNSRYAIKLAFGALNCNFRILIQEPSKTATTLVASLFVWAIPKSFISR
ncbi:MAG: glycosyltransferase involved in cell wall biosynthesis [Polaribacter sp.]|jgi:glycosyltransferase involved in cell wall biosynthesis